MKKNPYDIEIKDIFTESELDTDTDEIVIGENQISVSDGQSKRIRTISADYKVENGDVVIFAKAAAPINIFLPLANTGKCVTIKNIANNTLSVYANNSRETIYDNTPVSLGYYDYATFISDGTNWGII